MKIETITEMTLFKILPLIAEYQKFYGCTPNPEKNAAFFGKFPSNPARAIQFAAFDSSGEPLGFTTLYFLWSSLSAQDSCTLNDLYTVPAARGKGVARKLLEHATHYARTQGFDRIEWMTQTSNQTAQRLYDKLQAEKSEWFYYSLLTR